MISIDMTPNNRSVHEIVAQLKALSEQLTQTNGEDDRRVLLRQFRSLLEQADQASSNSSGEW
jgi:hypothetical protein